MTLSEETKNGLWGIGGILALSIPAFFIVGECSARSGQATTHNTHPARQKDRHSVSAGDMAGEFFSSAAGASLKYKGSEVTITGYVTSVTVLGDYAVIVLSPGIRLGDVSLKRAATVNTGDAFSATCVFDGRKRR